jgi:hypothetical protein
MTLVLENVSRIDGGFGFKLQAISSKEQHFLACSLELKAYSL